MKRPIFIGITGGTGSGKSTIAKEIYRQFGEDCIAMIEQDSYYKDQSHLSMEDRVKTNYDHPNAFDNNLLVSHLESLLNGHLYKNLVMTSLYIIELKIQLRLSQKKLLL